MVVAHNHINAFFVGIAHFFVVFDTAIQHNKQLGTAFVHIVYAAATKAVTVFVSVGNKKVEVGTAIGQKRIDHSHCGGAVHIVVAVNKNLFFAINRLPHPVHGLIHVLHQKGVVQVGYLGMKEFLNFVGRVDSALIKQAGYVPVLVQVAGNVSLMMISFNPTFLCHNRFCPEEKDFRIKTCKYNNFFGKRDRRASRLPQRSVC